MKKIKQIWYYLQGNMRCFLYYSKSKINVDLKWLLSDSIQEQFEYRLRSIRKQCYEDGQCEVCECSIPQLLFADKACEGGCYPEFLSREEWEELKKDRIIWIQSGVWKLTATKFTK